MQRYFLFLITGIFLVHPFSQIIFSQEATTENKIESINIIETDTETFITLTGTGEINYNIFKIDDPPTVSLDLGNFNLEELKSSYSVDNQIIKDIKIIREVEGGLPISRIQINLEKLMEFSASSKDNKLLITISKITAYKPKEVPTETTEIEGELLPDETETETPGESLAEPETKQIEEGGGTLMEEIEGELEPGTLGASAPELPSVIIPETAEEGIEKEVASSEEVIASPEEVEISEEEMVAIEEEPIVEEAGPPGEEPAPVVIAEGAVAEGPSQEKESIEKVIEENETAPPPPEETEKPAVIAQTPPVESTPIVAPAPLPSPPQPPPEKEKKLAWIKGDRIITSEKLVFSSNSALLDTKYEQFIREIAKILIENPGMKIRIEGHTDNVGDPAFNRALSEYRAIWIKLLLERFGVDPSRIEVAGKGDSSPIASNKTEAGREKNRRVEFIIIQK